MKRLELLIQNTEKHRKLICDTHDGIQEVSGSIHNSRCLKLRIGQAVQLLIKRVETNLLAHHLCTSLKGVGCSGQTEVSNRFPEECKAIPFLCQAQYPA